MINNITELCPFAIAIQKPIGDNKFATVMICLKFSLSGMDLYRLLDLGIKEIVEERGCVANHFIQIGEEPAIHYLDLGSMEHCPDNPKKKE